MLDGRRFEHVSAWHYALCYTLYLAILGLCYQSFWIWRAAVEVVTAYYFRRERTGFESAYLTTMVVVGLILFVIAFGAEGYLRNAIERVAPAELTNPRPLRKMVIRFAQITIPMLVLLALAVVLQEYTARRAGL